MTERKSSRKILKQARAALDTGNADEALELCEQITLSDSKNYHAYVLAGVAASRMSELAGATDFYRRAIALRPELPLAWKGLLDLAKQFPPTKAEVGRRAQVAEAHEKLAELVLERRDVSLLAAANAFTELANETKSEKYIVRAVKIWKEVQKHRAPSGIEPYVAIVHLLAINLPNVCVDGETEEKHAAAAIQTGVQPNSESNMQASKVRSDTLVMGELSDALDCCERCTDPFVVSLMAERCQIRARRGLIDPNYAIALLKELGCAEEALTLFEEDKFASLSEPQQWDVASSVLDSASKVPSTFDVQRSRVCAILASRESDIDASRSMAGVDAVTPRKKAPVENVTIALVRAVLHIRSEEYKAAAAVAEHGRAICQTSSFCCSYRRVEAALCLVIGYAYRRIHKYDRAAEAFRRSVSVESGVAEYGHCFLIETCMLKAGREAGETLEAISIAVEKGIAFAELEKAWGSVLSAEAESVGRLRRAVDICIAATRKSEEASVRTSEWPAALIRRVLKIDGDAERTAADALTRLGQTQLANDSFQQAKASFMRAALLSPGYPTPVFFLGYLFECLANGENRSAECQRLTNTGYKDRFISRAIRCYKKGLALQTYHPLGSRRLARLYASQGDKDAASAVARAAVDDNLLAAWAWNILGWSQLDRDLPQEACNAFQSALRSRKESSVSPIWKDALYGTYLGPECLNHGQCFLLDRTDTDDLVTIDSWRGLALCYREVGRFKSSLAGIHHALSLCAEKASGSSWNIRRKLLMQDKALCLILLGRPLDAAAELLREQNVCDVSPASRFKKARPMVSNCARTNVVLGEAYSKVADELWISGAYRQSTEFRELSYESFLRGAEVLKKSVRERGVNKKEIEHIESTCLAFKLAGDAAAAAATFRPDLLSRFVGNSRCGRNLKSALEAYGRAQDVSQGIKNPLILQDIAGVTLQRHSCNTGSQEECRQKFRSLFEVKAPLQCLAAWLMSIGYEDTALQMLLESTKRVDSCPGVNAAIAQALTERGELDLASKWAKKALEVNAASHEGWLVLARLRELQALRTSTSYEKRQRLASAAGAYKEAVQLGGGVEACDGVARCLERGLLAEEHVRSKSAIAEALTWSLRAGQGVNRRLEDMACDAERQELARGVEDIKSWDGKQSSLVEFFLKWPNTEKVSMLMEELNVLSQ